jgi:hypothetical protein
MFHGNNMDKAIVNAKYSFFKMSHAYLVPCCFWEGGFWEGGFCLKSDSLLATNINLINTLFQMR